MAKNSVQENIRVVCRIRPQTDAEAESDSVCVRCHPDSRTVEIAPVDCGADKFQFNFDRVFSEYVTQEDIYEEVAEPILEAVLGGINAAVIAYGQTGSGKTHTMYGGTSDENRGLIRRMMVALFRRMFPEFADPNEEFYCAASFVQIYKERVLDLLADDEERFCQIRQDQNRGLWVTDAIAEPMFNVAQLSKLIRRGEKNRVTAATLQNASSSRSHSILILSLARRLLIDRSETYSQLYLVDLAGSESVERTLAEGEQLEESKHINQSLFTLRQVINSLVTNKSHVPYRDSRLTRLLQNSFGGNSKTTVIVCCSPSSRDHRETLSTFRFAASTREIKNQPKENVHLSVEELTRQLAQSMKQIEETRTRVHELKKILKLAAEDYDNNALEQQDKKGKAASVILQSTQTQEEDLMMTEKNKVNSVCERTSLLTAVDATLPAAFRCPLSGRLMLNPVIAMDGYTYELQALQAFFEQNGRTPDLNGQKGVEDQTFITNVNLQNQITLFNSLMN